MNKLSMIFKKQNILLRVLMKKFLKRTMIITEKLVMLHFFLAGQSLKVSQILEIKKEFGEKKIDDYLKKTLDLKIRVIYIWGKLIRFHFFQMAMG